MKKGQKISVVIICILMAVYGFFIGHQVGMDAVDKGRRMHGVYKVRTVIENNDTIKSDTSSRFLRNYHSALSDTLLNPQP